MLLENTRPGERPLASNNIILPQPPLQCRSSDCICVPFPTLHCHRGFRQPSSGLKTRVAILHLTCIHNSALTISFQGLYMSNFRT